MINIIKQEIEINEQLKKKVIWVCRFNNTNPIIKNGGLLKLEPTNVTYVEPHRITINDKLYLLFNCCDYAFIGNLNNKLQPLAITLNNANEQIKMLNDNNKALSLRNFKLNKKVNEYENTISNLEEENYSLRIKVTHLKKKFKKMLKFLYDKLFGWGKKEPIYN